MTTPQTQTNDEQDVKDLEIEMNAVMGNLDQAIAHLGTTSETLDSIDKELDEADGLLTTLYDEVSDFEDEKGDEIDALVLNALVSEEIEETA